MTHRKGAVWTERLVVALILASLAGTLNLVLAIHRRVVSTAVASKAPNKPPPSPPVASKTPLIAQKAPAAPPVKKPLPPPVLATPPKPVEDPTVPILARIDRAIVQETHAAREADRHAAAMEAARHKSVAESERWKRRELLVRQQVATLSRKADRIEQDALSIEAERDVLARERDALKAALVKGSQRSGYAVLPYKGPNGTWRRPIVLECSGNSVRLQPNGPTFSMMELSPLIHPRSSPVVLAIAREMMHIQRAETPDGAPAVPYLVFLVRPDGIRPYYQARARLEPLGIAFGYELIEQDLAVDIPDFDDVRTWDGTVPLDMPEIAGGDTKTSRSWPPSNDASVASDSRGSSTWPAGDRTPSIDVARSDGGTMGRNSEDRPASDRRWPDLARGDGSRGGTADGSDSSGHRMVGASTPEINLGGSSPRGDRAEGGRSGGSSDGSPDDFVWPTGSGDARPRAGARRGNERKGRGSADSTGMGDGLAGMPPAGMTGSDRPGGGESSRGGASEGGSQGVGRASRGVGQDSPLAGAFGPGRGAESSPSDGASQGGGTSGHGSGTGLDGGNGDALPGLEPAKDGTSRPGTPPSGHARGAGGLGGTAAGPRGSVRSATSGLVSDGSGGDRPTLKPTTARPGNSTTSVRANDRSAPDPGLSPYAGGDSGPARAGLDSGSSSDGQAPARGDTTASAPAGFGGTRDANKTVADGGQSGAGESSGSSDSAPASRSPNRIGSSSAPPSGRRGSGSIATSPSSPILGTPEPAPADAGLPPTPLEAALGSSSSSPGSSASALGAGASGTMDGSAAGSPGAMGSASASSSAAMSGLSGLTPPSTMPAGMSGMSLPALSASPDSDSEPDALKGLSLPPIDTHRQPGAIDVPFEIVVVCRRDDVLLHPGGYRITAQALQAGAGKGDNPESLLQRELRAIVRRRAQVDPLIRPKPRVKFLVETGGGTTFWTARKQLTFSGMDWPMTVQVAGPQSGYLLDERALR